MRLSPLVPVLLLAAAAQGDEPRDTPIVVLGHTSAAYPFQGLTKEEVLARYKAVFVMQPVARKAPAQTGSVAGDKSADEEDEEEVLHQCWIPQPSASEPAPAPAEDPASFELRQRLAKCQAALGHTGLTGGRPPAIGAPGKTSPSACMVRQLPGYWSYEVCPSLASRQFHAAAGSSAAAAATAEHSLGLHDPAADEVAIAPSGALVYLQSFVGGDGGRSAVAQYTCDDGQLAPGVVSAITSITEDPPLHYTVTVAVRDPTLCEALPSPATIVAPVNETCFSLADGWWSYSVCLGKSITQYHVGSGGEHEATTTIGTYNAEAGEVLETASLDSPAAVVQSYADGTPCAAAGGAPRRARVRFVCNPRGSSSGDVTYVLQGVREPATCAYEFTITTSAACRHPELPPPPGRARGPAGPTTFIHCVAWDPSNPVPAGLDENDEEDVDAASPDAASDAERGALDAEPSAEAPTSTPEPQLVAVQVEVNAEAHLVVDGEVVAPLLSPAAVEPDLAVEEPRPSDAGAELLQRPPQHVEPPEVYADEEGDAVKEDEVALLPPAADAVVEPEEQAPHSGAEGAEDSPPLPAQEAVPSYFDRPVEAPAVM